MRGTLIGAWRYAWLEIWIPLRNFEQAPEEILPDLVREIVKALPVPPEVTAGNLEEAPSEIPNPIAPALMAMSDRKLAEDFIREIDVPAFRSERHLIRFFEEVYFILDEYDCPGLTDFYSQTVADFLDRHNLRYRLIEPFQLVPHLPAVFSGLVERVSQTVGQDEHLCELLAATEQAFEDLTTRTRPADMKTCIAKVCLLAEGLALRYPGVTADTLGQAVKEADCWPHATIRNALSALYGFCSDYPAIRHVGKPKSKLRELELRDALIISMLLFGFSGYLSDVDYEEVFALKGVN